MKRTLALAKLTRPQPTQALNRTRLFRLLDRARRHPIIWIAGPPGAGKTTLVSTYLAHRNVRGAWYEVDEGDRDPATFFYYLGLAIGAAAPRQRRPLPHLTAEYLRGLSAFARRYFEQAYDRLGSPAALVLDNYHAVPDGETFHQIMRDALAVIPAGINVFIISRAEQPPAPLARYAAHQALTVLGWDALRLTKEESGALARHALGRSAGAETVKQLYAATDGWPAGLMLMLERWRRIGSNAAPAPSDSVSPGVFDYFAAEVFEAFDPAMREFLLRTAYLPKLTAPLAGALAGTVKPDKVLAELAQRNYFTVRHAGVVPTYEYHPLFRAFLKHRAVDTYTPEALRTLKREAADLLADTGETETAVALLQEIEAWDVLAALALRAAPTLIAQGRHRTLAAWLAVIPPSRRRALPWLHYWSGVCELPFDPVQARHHLEAGYEFFRERGDRAGLLSTWCVVIDSFVYEWGDFHPLDRWIAELDRLLAESPEFPSVEIGARVACGMFMALMYRQPQHPHLPQWAERVQAIVLSHPDVCTQIVLGNQLLLYYTGWIGDLGKARLILDAVRPPPDLAATAPLAFIAWRSMEGAYHWFTAAPEKCLSVVDEGLRAAQQSQVHLLTSLLLTQGVVGSLTADDIETAGRLLEAGAATITGARPLDRAHYHYLVFLHAFYSNDAVRAVAAAREAVALGDAAGVPFAQALYRLGLALILLKRGGRKEALLYLTQARRLARMMRSANLEFGCLYCLVLFALDRRQSAVAVALLRKTLAIARQRGFVNRPMWTRDVMARLFRTALENDIEVEYVQQVIRKRRLTPPEAWVHLENWPWEVRIHTLGRFSIAARVPQRSSGKPPRKPLELLKLLVAAGARGVPVERALDALWSGADGDNAYHSYTSAVYRLRKLLGAEVIITREGRIALDASRCWVDSWAFEHWLDQAAGRIACSTGPVRALERALALYQGAFLADDSAPWVVAQRERLHSRYARALLELGRHYEERGAWARAFEAYQQGLERDDLSEALYQRVLVCCRELGRRPEGLAAYERCQKRLRVLGVAPSAHTKTLRDALLNPAGA